MNSKTGLFFFVVILSLGIYACRSPQKVEMRTLVPNKAIVYLEINDLAKALESLTDSQAFQELAGKKPDFSAFGNLQIAVAVTSFKTSEKQIDGENSILNFTPQFVAVAETHAWSWQTVSFAENQLDNFVRKSYGEDAKLEISEKENGRFFTWTAADNRKVFAFVRDSLIYFGNDAAAIENCPALKKGEADSLIKNESLTRAYSENNLAFGYVSPEGIAQISDFAGVSIGVEKTEEPNERSFIAGVLPQILRNTTEEIVWTANKNGRGIEDNFKISLTTEAASVVSEILAVPIQPTNDSINFLPEEIFSATRYNLKNPSIAWRSLLLLTAKNSDTLSGNLLLQFSDALLEPYGVSNAEAFLDSVDSEITTAQFDADGEKSVAIVVVRNSENIKKSISKEINFRASPTMQGNAEIWLSEDKRFAAAFVKDKLILGESQSVLKSLQAGQSGQNFTKNSQYQKFAANDFAAVTFGRDMDSAEKLVGVLADRKNAGRKLATFYQTETRFSENKIERKNLSDFGFIGTILKQISK